VVSNPEFLREGSAIEDFMHPDRVVIGTRDERAAGMMMDVYSPLHAADVPFIVTDIETAELIKYASNGFLATKISFINEVAHICEAWGANVEVVSKGMGLDNRIGPKFLSAGPGYGGSCFPKDTRAAAQIARDSGLKFRIIEAVLEVNEATQKRMVEKVDRALGGCAGKTIAVLGLSFKPNTDDIRESPALPIVQALAVASGALPVFWLARKHLASSRAGAHFALAYLLFPATQFNAFTITSSFHSVAIAVPLVLYAVWFLDEDRLVAFSGVALLAFTTKEEIPLAVGCLGIWYAVRKGRRLFGACVFAAGLGVTLFNFLWVIPHFSPAGVDPFSGRYRAVGGTPQGIAHKLVTDPMAFVHAVTTGHKALYLGLLLVPFLGLWLLEPLLFLGAVPDLAINLLSHKPDQTSINFHWTAGIVPFVVAASIFGAARFGTRAVPLSLWVLVAAGCLALWSPIYLGSRDVRALGSPLVSAKAHAVGLIPDGVAVSATNQLGGHLAARRYIRTFPAVGQSQWIVVDANDPTEGDTKALERDLRRYESSPAWRTVFASHGVAVLRRRSP